MANTSKLTPEASIGPAMWRQFSGSLDLLDEPLHTLLQPLTAFGTAGLNLPGPITYGWQRETVSNLCHTDNCSQGCTDAFLMGR